MMRMWISSWQCAFRLRGDGSEVKDLEVGSSNRRVNRANPSSWSLLALLGLVLMMSSCASTPPIAAILPRAEPVLYEWYGEGLVGQVRVDISLDDQMAYVTIGGEDAGWSYLATGLPKYATPTGNFKILEKVVDKHSNLWGVVKDANGKTVNSDARNGRDAVPPGGRFVGAHMPYWMRLTNSGIGMHVGIIPEPGLPASHGCIRLPRGFAQHLFAVAPLGTAVSITGTTPHAYDYNYGQRRINDTAASVPMLAASTLR